MRSSGLKITCAAAFLLALTGTGQAQTQIIDVPAQPLAAALAELSAETGLQVLAASELVAGLNGTGVQGSMSPLDALKSLLRGTGLTYRATGGNGVIVVAQTADETNGRTSVDEELIGEDIIVQGELQARSLQDTQTSVAVIRGEALERRSDNDLDQVVERTAGVAVQETAEFSIRGVSGRGVDGGGGAPTITTVVDGARVSNFNRRDPTLFSTWDLEQVEILRGPQSTQSGRNALAGAVIVRSKDPSFEPEFKIRSGFGNGGTFVGAFAANIPVIEDTLSFRLSGEIDRTRGFADNLVLGTDDAMGERRFTFRAGVRFEPTEDFSAILKLNYVDYEEGTVTVNGASFPSLIAFEDFQDRQATRLRSANLRLGYDINDEFRIESDTTFFDRKIDIDLDQDNTPAVNPLGLADNDSESFEKELKIFYENDQINAVLGGFYTQTNELDIIDGGFFSFNSTTETENFAFFGEAEVEVIDGLRLIAGGRYDRETVEVGQIITFLGPTTSSTSNATFDAFLPKAGLVYNFTDDVSLGFTYQRGYRAGGAFVNPFTSQLVPFDPEFTNTYEVAFRSEWFEGDLTVNANGFFTQWKDQQVRVLGSNGGPPNLDLQTENAGRSRLFGGELDVNATPLPGLELFAGIGYTQTEFLDFVNNGVQLAGNDFVNAPEWTASFGGTYTFDEGFFLSADASFQSSGFSNVQNTLNNDSRFLANLRAGYEAENWGIFAYVDNLFDNRYILSERLTPQVHPGEPRTFGLVGQMNF
ncbi:MAG: TonB-dependent receptor [Pseudomonadota bacterium]